MTIENKTLYEITGDIKDANTLLVNRAELKKLVCERDEACAKSAVPEGWELVPKKLTSAMFFAWTGTKVFDEGLPHEQYQACYRAMLNAAPIPGETK